MILAHDKFVDRVALLANIINSFPSKGKCSEKITLN